MANLSGIRALFAVAALLVVLGRYGLLYAEESQQALAKIGLLLPLSGSYAAVGEDARQGFELGLEELNARKYFSLVYSDAKSDPSTAVTEFKKLVEADKVSAVYTFRAPIGMAVNPLSLQAKIPLLGGVGNKDFSLSNKYAFQFWPPSDEEGRFLAQEIVRRKFRRVALFTAQDEWTESVSLGFRESFSMLEGQLVADKDITPSDTDFRALLTQLRDKKIDAMFFNVGLMQIAAVVRQAREQGLSAAIFSNFWCAKKEVVEMLGSDADGLMYAEMATNLPTLNQNVLNKYGNNISGATISGYAAAILLAQAVKGAEKELTPAEMYSRLLEQPEIRSANGNFPVVSRRVRFPLVLKALGPPVE